MKIILIAVVAAIVVLALIAIIWRQVARARALPCPSWLSWLVEDAFLEAVIGPVAGSGVLLDRAGVTEGMRVLDAGCGVGRLAIPAAKRVGPQGEVVGLDIQEGMLKKFQQRVTDEGLTNVRTILGGLGRGLVEKHAFDRCFLVTVLGEIPESERMKALRELYDALKPGGILSITEIFPDPHYQRRDVVLRMGRAAGFLTEQQYGHWAAYTINCKKPEHR